MRRWKKALKAEPGLMLCGKRIVQHCDRFVVVVVVVGKVGVVVVVGKVGV